MLATLLSLFMVEAKASYWTTRWLWIDDCHNAETPIPLDVLEEEEVKEVMTAGGEPTGGILTWHYRTCAIYSTSDVTYPSKFDIYVDSEGYCYEGIAIFDTSRNYDVNRYKITELHLGAFSDHSELVSVVVPAAVTKINQFSFGACANLETVTLPAALASMGKNQFQESPKIRLIRALNPEPPTTDATDNYYFSAPKSGFGVTLIVPVGSAEKYKAKVEWQNFTIIESTFEVDGIAYSLTSIDDMTIEVASKSGGYSGEVNIPETVTIDNNTFRVTAIGENAFKGCSNVTSVNIPSTVTEIKKNAFSGCTNLKLTIPSSVTSICEGALDGVQEVKMVSSTPPSLSDMSDYTTTVVRVPVTSLEAYVGGKRWSNYKTLLGYGTAGTTFDYGGITYCMLTDDETCEVTKSSRDGYSYNPSTYSGDIVIPETVGGITVTQIGNFGEGYSYGAFYRATNVTSIRLPETITTIKDHAFQDCSGLTSINLPDGITKIGERAFSNCI